MGIRDFFTAPKTYHGGDDPVNPNEYEQAKDEWDRINGRYIAQNTHLKRLLLLALAANLALSGGLVTQSLKATVVPYVVEVGASGIVNKVGLAEGREYDPKDAEIKYFLAGFVRNIRGVPLDPVVYRQSMNTAYGFLTKQAGNKMSVILRDEDPAQKLGKQTVQVQIGVMLPMADGSKSYQIRWSEEQYDLNTGAKKVVPMSGIFTIVVKPPTDRRELEINPLGIYISDFSWSEEVPGEKGADK